MAAPSATQTTTPDYTYGALVNGITTHPLFPLIIKKSFDVCQSNVFERSRLVEHFAAVEHRATELQNFAQQHGLAAIGEPWTSTDLFMSALVASFNQVSSTGAGENDVLRHTIADGQRILSGMWKDPRCIGNTEIRQRPEGVQSNGHVAGENVAHQPSASGEVVASAQRSDEQPSSGTEIRRATTRKALSDKAKQTLDRWFKEHISDPYPSKEEKEQLAAQCGICLSSVNNWFGNKRMRVKRKMLPVKSRQAEEESIAEKVLAPKSKWNAVVVSKISTQAGRDALESATGASVPVQPLPEAGRNEYIELKRDGTGSSVAAVPKADAEHVGESSQTIHPRRSRRKQGQPGSSTLSRLEKSSDPEPPPLPENIGLPREGQHAPSQLRVGVSIMPRSNTFAEQVQNGVEAYKAAHPMVSQTQPQNSGLPSVGLPSTSALTGRIREGSEIYREGQSLPPLGHLQPSILPSIAANTKQVRNNNAVYPGGHTLPPHALREIPPLKTTAEETQRATYRETHAMRTRQRDVPLNLQSQPQIPTPSLTGVNPRPETQHTRDHLGCTTQFSSEKGPPETENAAQDSRAGDSSQIRPTAKTQLGEQGRQTGPSRSTRSTKRRKLS